MLPPKKTFGNKSKEFVSKRREGLQAYLQQLCAHPVLRHSLVLKQFLDFKRYLTLDSHYSRKINNCVRTIGWFGPAGVR